MHYYVLTALTVTGVRGQCSSKASPDPHLGQMQGHISSGMWYWYEKADLEELVAIKPDGGVQGRPHIILQGHPNCLYLGQV